MIKRAYLEKQVLQGLRQSPVVALLGTRQCGKTTLARSISSLKPIHFFDLENPRDLARLQNPQLALESLKGLVVLDEIQRAPEIIPLLRVFADRKPLPCRFLILGSASPSLMKHASESLAGRVQFVDMSGFSLDEVGSKHWKKLWLRGGFPDSFLAKSNQQSFQWRENFIRTFLERDIPQLGISIPTPMLRRFWTMVAHYHGQVWNGSEIGSSLGITYHTTKKYLDILTGAFVVRQLPPWHENLGKRVVKTPKIYVRDTGLLHSLLDLDNQTSLESHPKLGASWEGFALEQTLHITGERNAYFWAIHAGAELDLLATRGNKRYGFEFKCQDAPTMTKSMHTAMQDLKLSKLWVIYPGQEGYPLDKNVECLGIPQIDRLWNVFRDKK